MYCNCTDNAEEGLYEIMKAIENKKPYDVLVLDMHFPAQGILDEQAGIYVIEQLRARNIMIPIIICSSIRWDISDVVGCIFYNPSRDLNADLNESLTIMRKQ